MADITENQKYKYLHLSSKEKFKMFQQTNLLDSQTIVGIAGGYIPTVLVLHHCR